MKCNNKNCAHYNDQHCMSLINGQSYEDCKSRTVNHEDEKIFNVVIGMVLGFIMCFIIIR